MKREESTEHKFAAEDEYHVPEKSVQNEHGDDARFCY